MHNMRTILAMGACYFLFAILLNSVGTVILQAINTFGVSKAQAASLEGFKDLPIAIVSFLVASFIPRVGYKLALLGGLSLVTVMCMITPIAGSFWALKALFAAVGCAFAIVKVSVYALIGQVTDSTKSHSSLLNTIEGVFMVGVLSGYWVFAAFLSEDITSHNWLNVYYLLSALSIATMCLVWFAKIEKPAEQALESGSAKNDFLDMLRLTYQPLVLVFVISAFLYVLIEQGVGTWLPTFNNQVLNLPVDVSVQLSSIFAASLAIGRLAAGQILKKVDWYLFLNLCLLGMAILVLLTLPMTKDLPQNQITSVFDAPVAAYLMPLLGLLMAPIYPVINSIMLSSLEKHRHAAMTGLIVVFSALGGTTGSLITGFVFEYMSGQHAFYMSLIPMAIITITLFLFKKRAQQVACSSAV
ncbi:MFS transporter [Pseudoalteromonas luteoviolacea]|uniref:MFS transporter n=1 Tax=Pseudoalteromonas luteoviolacea TaxID=43657 RepID=A0A0C1QKZ1_9GAMM|nr:MFS transporter [Pseudoalteromonas luteoviolacea]KID55687.1 MFS transporter [Pseudoalteromonas luteoviolacea]KID56411.1 MFS transporter [Pseudoalteromonas luteoviolacea]